ncbi:metal ABC transporter solute-binding protein, Zn/Mn family [Salsuginibacillus kocurii]|uniref:metal ABC transporter solute-binding protein, Zn/Mn family n=1 Tax=Salsuginibacillus kocurii TaxID=427078 RepID=UPI000375028A|nr:zinc ABC transporter substrate-binding protein [Salsuginibacillus kocurii]
MKKGLFTAGVLALITLSACNENTDETEGIAAENDADEQTIYVTTSFSVLADYIEQVVGDRGEVDYIVPRHEEPHEYEPVPSDFEKVSDSEVFYINGLNLEEWLEGLVENVGDIPVVELAAEAEPIELREGGVYDPHVWLSPEEAPLYIEALVEDLSERDPDGADEYRENADAYLEELEDLHAWTEEQMEEVAEEHRLIVTSENAFEYFGRSYGLDTEGVWEINSHEEGTPGQVARLVDVINDREVPALFKETTVSPDYIETVSENTGVEISGEVYTDSVGEEGSGAEDYISMIEHNVETFRAGLAESE